MQKLDDERVLLTKTENDPKKKPLTLLLKWNVAENGYECENVGKKNNWRTCNGKKVVLGKLFDEDELHDFADKKHSRCFGQKKNGR